MKFKSTSMLFYLQLEVSYFDHKNLESLEIQNYVTKCLKTILSAKHILFLRTSSLWRTHSQKERMCFSPVSSMRLWRGIAARKGSSLQDWVWVPTKSELVAIIRALSSLRLTPAIEATSLMSSSSLKLKKKKSHRKPNSACNTFIFCIICFSRSNHHATCPVGGPIETQPLMSPFS